MSLPGPLRVVHCGLLVPGGGDPPLRQATLVLDGDRVHAIEPGWPSPAEGQPIDLRDAAVMPGRGDGHDHFGIEMGDGEPAARQDPQWRALKGTKNARAMLASGITTLRNAGEMHHLGRHVRAAIEAGWLPGPRTVLSGIPICSTGGHGWFLGIEADGADAVRAAVRANVKGGADMIKMIVTGGVTTPGGTLARPCFTRAEIEAAVDESHLAGKRIGVHCYGGPAATWAIDAGVDSIEHGTYLTEAQLDAMAARQTFLVSTVGVMRAAADTPSVAPFMRERFRQVSEDYVALLERARARGIRVAVGCDTHHAALADEVDALLAAGYTPTEALRAATTGGAELCGREGEVGALRPGMLADFLALDRGLLDDPTGALRRVRAVYKGGARQPTSPGDPLG